MKAIIAALLTAFTLSAATADAQTPPRKSMKHRSHNYSRHHKRTGKVHYYGHDQHVQFKQGDEGRPNAYHGDNVPENDGVQKNEQRNVNYQSGQPLPPNTGTNGRR